MDCRSGGGKRIAIDTTVVSAVTERGTARGRNPGHVLTEAKRHKELKYHELLDTGRCHLLVMGFEIAGRWSEDSVTFLRLLAKYKAQSCPELLRSSAQQLFFQRWTGLMACAVQRAYACSLLGQHLSGSCCVNGSSVALADLDRLT